MDRFEDRIKEFAEAVETAASFMLGMVLLFLGGRTAIEEALRGIEDAAEALLEDSREWVEDYLPEVYTDGMRTSLDSEDTPDIPAQELTQEVHDEALELFIEDLIGQVARITQNISEDAKASLREAARQRLAASLGIGPEAKVDPETGEPVGTNARDEARRMEEDMRERGIKFVDKRGRKWGPREYSEMVLRTHTIEVSNEANLNTAAELGSSGVGVVDGGPGDVDEPCKIANGQKWSLRYARLHRTEHPNCRRAFYPLPSTYSGPLDRE